MEFNDLDDVLVRIYTLEALGEQKRGERRSIFKHLAKLTEEVGELSEALLEIDGYKTNSKDKNGLHLEAKKEVIDILIMGFVIAGQLGMSREEILSLFEEKLDKWMKKHIEPINQ